MAKNTPALIGGTGKDLLLKQHMDVVAACETLIETLRNAMPHGRDYVGNDEGYRADCKDTEGEIDMVETIRSAYALAALELC